MQRKFGEPFRILLVWSEQTLSVATHQTALDALTAAGVPVEPGCLTGTCGTCATRFVDGDILHKDSCLTQTDRETLFCPCVSRARGTLVLPL